MALHFASRRAGVCLHLTSLPGPRGIGELGKPAIQFLDWMSAHGLSVWQFLPTGPTGYGDSPYQPLSVFAGNPLLINLDDLVAWGLLDITETGVTETAPANRIDYSQVARCKTAPLNLAAQRLRATTDRGLRDEFEAFCGVHGPLWLDDFAAFTVLKTDNGEQSWLDWPAADRAWSAHRVDALRQTSEAWQHARCIQFFFFRQWQALRTAARERGILLFGDVPIYMALDCAEAWARPDLLELDGQRVPTAVAGVPPDYFSADGQLWGNPIYRWSAHAADGFQWWIARMRHALALADIVRLDHFRGFDAFWAVPYGATTARDGQWQPGPGGALFDALTDALGSAPFVAEDLGIITESVTELRKAYALPGMQVLQFLIDHPEFDITTIEEDCVCYTGTHDNDTSEGWFAGSAGHISGDALHYLQGTARHHLEQHSESIHKAMISLCFSTRASLAIAPMQDILGLGSESRLNTPGLANGNWQWRLQAADLHRHDLSFVHELAIEHDRI